MRVFASTEAGRGKAADHLVFTQHGGKVSKISVMRERVRERERERERVSILPCYAVPAIPTLTSVERLSGKTARIVWIPLSPDEARGLLTLLEIDYYAKPRGTSSCTSFGPMDDSQIVHIEENLFEQTTANITDLVPNHEYCVAIQVSTSAGDSGFSNILKLPCK